MDSNEFGVFTVEICEPEQLESWMKQKNPKEKPIWTWTTSIGNRKFTHFVSTRFLLS